MFYGIIDCVIPQNRFLYFKQQCFLYYVNQNTISLSTYYRYNSKNTISCPTLSHYIQLFVVSHSKTLPYKYSLYFFLFLYIAYYSYTLSNIPTVSFSSPALFQNRYHIHFFFLIPDTGCHFSSPHRFRIGIASTSFSFFRYRLKS